MPLVTVATLNLFNRMGEWEQRFPLVVQQLTELAVLPFERAQDLQALGIQPPNAVLLHGPPGTAPHPRSLQLRCGQALARHCWLGQWRG